MSNALFIKSGRRYRAATPQEVYDAAAAAYVARESGIMIGAPRDAHELCRVLVGHYENERFGVLFLDGRHRLLAAEVMFTGTIDGATVYPRVVVKRALELNASAIILTHQHPSGVAEPSEQDRVITQRLSKALALVEIRLLDHVALDADQTVSLAERRLAVSPASAILDALAHDLGLFAPPLQVCALVPRRAPNGDHCAAIWVARVPDDGRVAMFFAMSVDDAGEWARTLLPDAHSIECSRLRGELGTPPY